MIYMQLTCSHLSQYVWTSSLNSTWTSLDVVVLKKIYNKNVEISVEDMRKFAVSLESASTGLFIDKVCLSSLS